jgi:hypothetical protein
VTGTGDSEGGEGSEADQWRLEPIFATIITAELNRGREGRFRRIDAKGGGVAWGSTLDNWVRDKGGFENLSLAFSGVSTVISALKGRNHVS